MVNNFVALDVETATSLRSSICEIGIAIVRDSKIVDTKSWFVQPPGNEYHSFNTYLHGIGPKTTKNSPLFPEVWEEVKDLLQGGLVVCHNSAFDMGALREALNLYNIEFPTFDIMCTIRPSKKTLRGLSTYTLDWVYKILTRKDMKNHHRACDDATACAEILLECCKINNVTTREEYENVFQLRIGHISPDSYQNQRASDFSGSGPRTIIKASDIIGDVEKNNPDSYFYGKSVCFTGTMSFTTRKELQQYIAHIGGKPVDSVTRNTDILVVGQQDFRIVGESGMSSKQRKALDLLSKGQDIEILSEADFLAYAGDFKTVK